VTRWRPVGPDDDGGQAAVELAIVLPLVFVMLLAVAQVVLVARDQLAVVHAAREAARAAAASGASPADGVAAGQRASGLPADRLQVSVDANGDTVRAVVRFRSPTAVPLIGALVDDVTVQAEAVMRREP
jgi:hypothetical protein